MMQQQMRDLDSMMMDPFGMMNGRFAMNDGRRGARQQMIDDGNQRHMQHQQQQQAMIPSFMDPFGGAFGFGGSLLGGMMNQMQQMQAQAFANPDSHVYTQSTMISMAPGQDGRTQVYERTESVRKQGDVKETRRSVRDSARGVEKMEIGHHIGNRGHVIQKRRDRATGGQILEQQEFIGLNQDDAERFDQEWTHATRRGTSGGNYFLDEQSHAGPHLAIEDDRRSRSHHTGPVIEEIPNTDAEESGRSRRRWGGGLIDRFVQLFRA
jgi:myeloid leukemia factor 1